MALAKITDEHLQNTANFWHPTEKSLWSQLNYKRRQKQFLVGRLSGKVAAAQYLGLSELKQVAILKGPFEQPILQMGCRLIPELTISHTDNIGVAAVANPGYRLGIDFESFSKERTQSLRSILPETLGRPSASQLPLATRDYIEWTSYESLSKVLGVGLTFPFKKFQPKQTQSPTPGVWLRNWHDFLQYQTLSFETNTGILSLTLPADTSLIGGETISGLLSQIRNICDS